ncbi:MAG: diguanylate cyclase [Bilifractor sp.]
MSNDKIWRIGCFISDWNQEAIFECLRGMEACQKDHKNEDIRLYIFENLGQNGSREKTRTGMSIFSLPSIDDLDALIIEGDEAWPLEMRRNVAQYALKLNLPVISINYPLEGCTLVGTDNYLAEKELTLHLLSMHLPKQLAFVRGNVQSDEAKAREQGFTDACRSRGISIDRIRFYGGTWFVTAGEQAAHKILDEGAPYPDTIVCANDDLAVGVADVLKDAGLRIPEDIRLCGFDHLSISDVYNPSITTIERNFFQIGYRAVETALTRLCGRFCPDRVFSPHRIVHGHSCGCSSADITHPDIRRKYIRLTEDLRKLYCLEAEVQQSVGKTHSIYEACHLLEEKLGQYDICNMYAVLNDQYLQGKEPTAEMNAFSCPMHMAIVTNPEFRKHTDNPQNQFCSSITRKNLLPEPHSDQFRLCIFYPLQFYQYPFGYVMMDGLSPWMESNTLQIILMLLTAFFERTRQKAQLEDISMRDALTGLYNRYGFHKIGISLIQDFCCEGDPAWFCFIDMDGMKRINDSFGHEKGDEAIQMLGMGIASLTDSKNYFCMRYGGDEFLIIGRHKIPDFQYRLQEILNHKCAASHFPVTVQFSMGETMGMAGAGALREAIQTADELMYQNKRERKVAVHTRNPVTL